MRCLLLVALLVPTLLPASSQAQGWFEDHQAFYVGEAGVALLSFTAAGMIRRFESPALPTRADLASPYIGRKHRVQQVEGAHLMSFAVATLGVSLAVEGAYEATTRPADCEYACNALLGHITAVGITLLATEIAKVSVARLRPDYRDRLAQGNQAETGRMSFFSGHTSMAFVNATFASLVVGGRAVWGDSAEPWSVPAGILGQAALMGYASWIGVTRIEDNRHHTSDVVVGALVGAGIASLVYFANYQSNGRPRFGESGSSPSQVAAPITVSFGGAF